MSKKEALHARSEAIADPKQACTRRDAPLRLIFQAKRRESRGVISTSRGFTKLNIT